MQIIKLGSHIAFKSKDECWLWTGRKNATTKYGEVKIENHVYGAHRVVASLFYGPHPDWVEVVRHTCDNPPCVNPSHLVYDTQSGNIKDAFRKGRGVSNFYMVKSHKKGSECRIAKLTEDDVRAIRASNEKQRVLAERYGIAQSGISQIRSRKTWEHVD